MAEQDEARTGTGLDERWIAPVQAGRQLGVTTTRVGQLVTDGQLKALHTPLGKLIDVGSVNQLLRERRARSGRGGR